MGVASLYSEIPPWCLSNGWDINIQGLKLIAKFLVCSPELDKDMMSLNSEYQWNCFTNTIIGIGISEGLVLV